ncbi:transposase [Burkholderiaceae bacterium UC74_6]
MARLPRLALAGHPHHIIQRGLNREPIVRDDVDRARLLAEIQESAALHKVAIHAYVLMDNHFHLLATPETGEGLSLMMQSVGRRYVAAFNKRHQRSGTLWDGRFRAAPLEADAHLLDSMRFIELNPLRSGYQLAGAQDYPWSSVAHHLGRRRDPLVLDHPLYWALGNTPFEREAAWRSWLDQGVSPEEARRLMDSAHKGWPLGGAGFLRRLSEDQERPVAPRPRGRPPRKQV